MNSPERDPCKEPNTKGSIVLNKKLNSTPKGIGRKSKNKIKPKNKCGKNDNDQIWKIISLSSIASLIF